MQPATVSADRHSLSYHIVAVILLVIHSVPVFLRVFLHGYSFHYILLESLLTGVCSQRVC